MITPRFALSQDDNYLIITIRAPYCDLKELELYVQENDFRFVCPPYYLRLNLPGNIVDNELSTGQFLHESNEFVFKYPKQNRGTNFEGLSFITSLLAPPQNKTNNQPQIEVISDSTDQDGNEWHIEQTLPIESETPLTNVCKYGFANQKYDLLCETESEYYSVFEIRNAHRMSVTERKNLKYDTESMDFSGEHYLADYFEDDMIKELVKFDNPWKHLPRETISFNENEKDILKDFPNKEYLLDTLEYRNVFLGLVDILYAYCYDKRTTEFEGTCESGWTITKLSSTISWFDVFYDEKQTITASFRRSLIYPLYRHFELCVTVLNDLKILLSLGNVFIVKCLIDIYYIFNSKSFEPRYILNDLYIKDYIIFMQKCPQQYLEETIKNVNSVIIKRCDVNLNLDQIVQEAVKNCIGGQSILDKMSNLNISNEESDSDSDSDSDSSEDSSSDSDDTSSSEECSESEPRPQIA